MQYTYAAAFLLLVVVYVGFLLAPHFVGGFSFKKLSFKQEQSE